MCESPTRSARTKQDSSIRVALELVKKSEASATFTAGDTGGTFAAALFVLKKMRDVQRPAIAAVVPTLKGFSVMVDVGANLNPRAQHIFQFGIMGSIYSEVLFGKINPTVAKATPINIHSEKLADAHHAMIDYRLEIDIKKTGKRKKTNPWAMAWAQYDKYGKPSSGPDKGSKTMKKVPKK